MEEKQATGSGHCRLLDPSVCPSARPPACLITVAAVQVREDGEQGGHAEEGGDVSEMYVHQGFWVPEIVVLMWTLESPQA